MANIIANLAVKIGVDTSEFQSKMDSLKNSLQKTGDRLKSVGTTMSASLTAPIVGLGTAVVMTGADFEEAMSKVQAVTGASGKELEQLEAKARELGATTKFSATEAAEAMGYLGMAGFKTNQIMDSMEDVLNLAAAGVLDLGMAADIASNIMSGFGMEAKEMGHIADVLAKSAASANTSVEQMGIAMSYVAPIAKGMGISLEESAAAIGILSNAGIQGERAGTALRGIIAQLSDVSGGTAKKLAELGLSAEDVNPKTKSLTEILKTLKDAGVTAADAMELVGVEAGPGLAALLESGYAELANFTNQLKNADGAAAQMAKTMSANTKGSFKELMSMLQELALQFYDALKPALEVAIDWLKQLTAWFQKLSPQAKTTIAVITGIAAVIGPLLIGFGFLIQGVMGVIKAFKGIVTAFKAVGTALNILRVAFMTNPFMLIIAAIIIVVALIIMHWDKIKEYLLKAWNWIKDTAASVWNGIKNFFSNVWNGIKNIVQSAVTWYLNRVKQNWQTIKSVTTSIWKGIKSFFSNVWNGIKSVVSNVANGIKSTVTNIWNSIKSATSNIWNSIKDTISKGISKAWSNIKSYAGKFLSAGKSLLESLAKGIRQGVEKAIDAVKRGMERIRSFLPFSPAKEGPLRDLDKSGRAFMDTFARGIQAGIPDVRRVVLDVAANVNPAGTASAPVAHPAPTYNITVNARTADFTERDIMQVLRRAEMLAT